MGSVTQWCSTAIVSSGWTIALGLNAPAIATPELPLQMPVDKAVKAVPLPAKAQTSHATVVGQELMQETPTPATATPTSVVLAATTNSIPPQSMGRPKSNSAIASIPRPVEPLAAPIAKAPVAELTQANLEPANLEPANLDPATLKPAKLDLEELEVSASAASQSIPWTTPLTASHYLTEPLAQTLPTPQRPQDFETPQSNDERFVQPGEEEPQPFQPDEEEAIEDDTDTNTPTPPAAGTAQPQPGNIQVENLTVKGSSILDEAEIQELAGPFVGRSVSEDSLQRLADAITERYLEEGYITSRAILNAKTLPTGQIEIQVLEGGIEEIQVEGLRHLNTSYIRSRVALGAQTPLNTGRLEDQLRLLRSSPLVDNIEASLRQGTQPAKSILVVRVTEAERFRASASADNYSPPSVGSERLGISLGYQNLTGIGDDLSFGFKHTAQDGSDTLDFTYRAPLNPMDGTLQFRTSFNSNNVVQEPFSVLDIRGNSELYELSFRQPLQRTPREEFALSAGLTYQTGQTFTFAGGTPFGFGPEADGTTTTTVLKLGQDYIKRDPRGAWALRSQFSIGLDLLDPTINDGPTPDGRFVSWLGQIQRVQVLNENNFLILSTDVQFASEALLSSQQFVIGGGQSIRGFRQNVRAGDGGLRFSVEDRITLVRDEAGRPEFIVAPFFDMGWIWYDPDNPNKPDEQQDFIAGTGVGLIWSPYAGITLRFDYAFPLLDLDDRTQNAQDDGVHFSVNIQI